MTTGIAKDNINNPKNIKPMLGISNAFLNNPWIKGKQKTEIRKYLSLKKIKVDVSNYKMQESLRCIYQKLQLQKLEDKKQTKTLSQLK